MKVVINTCYGGFSLSMLATKRLAELQGRECYFFIRNHKLNDYKPIKMNDKEHFWLAFDTPNPNDVTNVDDHYIDNRSGDRSDPLLVQVVEELGDKANGVFAKLKIIEIPDGLEYIIEEYDGIEHVAEAHRTWS